MKKAISFLSVLMSIVLTSAVYAQTTGTGTQDQTSPARLNDPSMSQRLQTDLTTRDAMVGTNPITWWDAAYGYNGTYMIDDVEYMANYDKKGNYVSSYRKADWTQVPSTLRTSFDQSTYKGQNVTGYWESTDPSKKGYYLEVDDKNGKKSRVWVDDKNKFSTKPTMNSNSTKPKTEE